jgi:hypothetical protein
MIQPGVGEPPNDAVVDTIVTVDANVVPRAAL